MKRNRGGEQDLDHIISAAIRGMDRAHAGVPGRAGPDPLPRPRLPVPAQRDHRGEGDRLPRAGESSASTSPAPNRPTSSPPTTSACSTACAGRGLGVTVHTGESGPVEEIAEVIEQLEPSRIGHGVKAAYDPRTMAMIRERGITLEVCPTQQPQHARRLRLGRVPLDLRHVPAQRRAVHDQHRRPGDAQDLHPRRALRLGRLGILSLEEQEQVAEWARQASFVEAVSAIPLPRRPDVGRKKSSAKRPDPVAKTDAIHI